MKAIRGEKEERERRETIIQSMQIRGENDGNKGRVGGVWRWVP